MGAIGLEGRIFTKKIHEEGKTTYDAVEWVFDKADILDDAGKVIFVQENVESPRGWTKLARNIVASKYFWGGKNSPTKENSVRSLIERVSDKLKQWAVKQGYYSEEEAAVFADEIAYLTLNQYGEFNSPVWFSVGVDRYLPSERKKEQRSSFMMGADGAIPLPPGLEYEVPQTSACFIQGVEDNLEDIMKLAAKEAMIFKYGSGSGTDLSTLRSSRERISGGGVPSGPLGYLVVFDKVAAIIKSGGKTRRAAKMNSLKVDHPDIKEFVAAKPIELDKMEALMRQGFSKEQAGDTVAYQNVNLSVRASDKFMRAVENDEEWQTFPVNNLELAETMPKYKARELMRLIAKATHRCGDPGMQYDDTINLWNTCSTSGRINASNPCSEFMFLDNSACNLASLRLTKFLREDGTFDVERYEKAVRLFATAQDIWIDASSFPTKEITENSHRYRPLGTGYADLGALIMSLGLPYDSDEARAVAASLTALHTGSVYLESTFMAEKKGTFSEYQRNRESMLKVIAMHRDALRKIDRKKIPKGLENIVEKAEKIWEAVDERGRTYGFRNAQATNLAPTGTIGFMMDCDTTGVEPDIGLVKYKQLAGGGNLKIANKTVRSALKKLGYAEQEIEQIVKYIEERDTIEGAPGIREKDLAVFDCAYKPKHGQRKIHHMGHIKMVAAIQPFLSGAISKTIGMPNEATVEDIEKAYMDSWKMGLKAVAIYRDGSRKDQPVVLSKDKSEEYKAVRRKLPITRPGIIHKFNIVDHEGYITVGLYPDGSPGELFVTMSKEGTTIGGLMDSFGTAISLCLQYGVPPKSLFKKFKNQNFEPRGMVYEGDPDIKTAKSIVDYIFTWMSKTFPDKGDKKIDPNSPNLNPGGVLRQSSNPSPLENKFDLEQEELGGFCPICQDNTRLIRKGHCEEICPKCDYRDPRGCGE